FQAEDGIRDKLVTGVQTCALPIWVALEPAEGAASVARVRERVEAREATRWRWDVVAHHEGEERQRSFGGRVLGSTVHARGGRERSEERRVGKESRGEGAGEDEEKK